MLAANIAPLERWVRILLGLAVAAYALLAIAAGEPALRRLRLVHRRNRPGRFLPGLRARRPPNEVEEVKDGR